MHRHQYKGRKLKREAGARKALLRNLTSQVILHEKITTTLEKAKEVRPVVEKLITKAKRGTLADRRFVGAFLSHKDKALEKLFAELGPLYKDRKGGYTRITKLPSRAGDNANMAQIELLETEKLTEKEMESKAESKKASPERKSNGEKVKKSDQNAKIEDKKGAKKKAAAKK